jgi:hypothetical protein
MKSSSRNQSRAVFAVFAAFAASVLLAEGALAQGTTVRVSVDANGAEGDDDSGAFDAPHLGNQGMEISGDGQCIAFASRATNLIPGDTNGVADVFVKVLATGAIERVSVDSSGNEANGSSSFPAPSDDGRFVAFSSSASNLVSGDANGQTDIFVHDRATGTTELVSVDSSGNPSNDFSANASISADGRYVAFISRATNLVANDLNGKIDVFVHDRSAGTTERVSVDGAGAEAKGNSTEAAISADGNLVAFSSDATNLVPGDTNGRTDVFLRDRNAGVTTRVSVDSSGSQATDDSRSPGISANGAFVAFSSFASNLYASDKNGALDVFVHDLASGVTECISLTPSGATGKMTSNASSISEDGSIVAFHSWADDLVDGDNNFDYDVFVRDRAKGRTERISVDDADTQSDSYSLNPSIARDGQLIAFDSWATNLVAGDTNLHADVFLRTQREAEASWANYGNGWAGTLGVPSFTLPHDPVPGAWVDFTLSNSLGATTVGLVLVGTQATSLHTGLGGDLLVIPIWTVVTAVPVGGATLSGPIEDDPHLYGVEIRLQALEADVGATKGVSFTSGLDVFFGR